MSKFNVTRGQIDAGVYFTLKLFYYNKRGFRFHICSLISFTLYIHNRHGAKQVLQIKFIQVMIYFRLSTRGLL